MTPRPTAMRGVGALRRLAAARPAPEHCELCAATLAEEHQHLVDPESRRILCACDACAILFDDSGVTRYRRVPRDIRELDECEIDDAVWNGLGIPIGLAFFFRSSASNTTVAVYPSPGGPTETSAGEEIDVVRALTPDVEALLVNRTRGARDYFIVPIDECYKLIGIVRQHWSGFSGGDELWDRLGAFFDSLKQRSRPERRAGHA